jgi:hypothetical protein
MSGPNHRNLSVGLAASNVDFEQAAEVDYTDGISMEEFDGRSEPVHARKVSVRKPEIIALFEYHPAFKEIMQGDDEELQKVLTDAGRYIDTQISARKIRLDDIKLLFEQLSKDPESPTGQIVENLTGVLESKITDVKNDFEAIKTVSDAVLQFLDTLDLRRQSTSQQAVFGKLRAKRFEENPLRLPKPDNKSTDFNQMMLNNLGERTTDEVDSDGKRIGNLEGSGTKMFLNFLFDLESLMAGPMQFPNSQIASRAAADTGDSDTFSKNRPFIEPIVNVTNGYGASVDRRHGSNNFGGGVCSLRTSTGNSFDASFAGKGVACNSYGSLVTTAKPQPQFKDIFYKGRDLNNGQACAAIAQTLVDDLAASTAIGSDDLVNAVISMNSQARTDATANPNRIRNFVTDLCGLDVLTHFRRAQRGQSTYTIDGIGNMGGLLSTALYDPDGAGGPKSPIRTFDPGVISVPDDDGVAKKIQNTAYDQLLKPILETMQEGDNVNTAPLEAFVAAVPDTLTKSADVLDQYFATSDPDLNPKAILIKVLTSIRNRIPDLNIGEGVDFSDGESAPMATEPMIDFTLLSEATRDVDMSNSYAMKSTARGNYTCDRIRVNDLLTMYLISVSKTKSVSGKYASVIPITAPREGRTTPNFSTIGRGLAKHIRMNLLNTYTNVAFRNNRSVTFKRINGTSTTKRNARAAIREPDVSRLSAESLFFEEGTTGVSSADFAGKIFSRSRRNTSSNVRVARWDIIQEKLGLDLENEHPAILGSGALLRPNRYDSTRFGNLAGLGEFNTVRTGGAFDVHPYKRIYGSQIEDRLTAVMGLKRNESIFSDIADVVDEIYDAAAARGPIVDVRTGKMIASGVDPAYLMSFVVSLYSIIIKDMLGIRFSPASAFYQTEETQNERNRSNLNGAALALWRDQNKKTSAIMQISNVVRTREVISDLNNFLTEGGEVDTLPDPGSHLGRFLSNFNEQVDGNTRARLDAIDIMRTLGDSLSTAANSYIESFVNDNNQIRVDKQFERIKSILPLAIDRTQVTAMRNQLQNVDSKEGFSRFFDDFMLSQAQENFFYGSLLGLGQGYQATRITRGDTRPSYGVVDENRVNFTTDKNISMLTVGIPQGFSKTVLGIDPVLEPKRFTERLVDVYVIARDHLSGEAVSIIPQPYTFDLGLFVDSVSDPIVSSPQTNSQLNEETSPEFLSNFNQSIANRKYPPRSEIFQNNIKMRRILLETGEVQLVSRPVGAGIGQTVFDNHAYDMLAKTYIKVTTGMSVTENDFFIDPSIEQRLATEPDLRNLSNLMNTHISQLLGRDVTFNDYLAGDRRFRELLNRLSKGEKTGQIIDEIKVNLEGTTEDANTLSSEDLVAFSRMISSNNPVITPGLFRDKIVSPRLFERVFSIFVNPDKFVGIPFPGPSGPQRLNRGNGRNDILAARNKQAFLREIYGGQERPALGPGIDRLSRNTFSGIGRSSSMLVSYEENQKEPSTMYQVLVVPHGTAIDFFEVE